MRPSRGMGAINPSKMPKAKTITRKDNPSKVKMFSEGGETKSDFDESKPRPFDLSMRKQIDDDLSVQGNLSPHIDKRSIGSGVRLSAVKKLAKDLDLEGYLEGYASKQKGTSARGDITGGGLRLTKHFAKGGKVAKPGLYDNIWAKRKRIALGSGEKMRKPGSSGAPTAKAFKKSALTAKK